MKYVIQGAHGFPTYGPFDSEEEAVKGLRVIEALEDRSRTRAFRVAPMESLEERVAWWHDKRPPDCIDAETNQQIQKIILRLGLPKNQTG